MHSLLIVDDQIDLADDLAANVPWHKAGITGVYKAYSAQEALDMMQTEAIDVVITDIKMPGMSGLEFISKVRAVWRDVKLILLSGYSEFEYARTALEHQVSDYLLKPASDEELLESVQRAVQELDEQWRSVASSRRAQQTLKENLPILRQSLLLDLLNSRRFRPEELARKLELLHLPFTTERPVSLMLVRLEDHFDQYEQEDLSLLEYAFTNIADEIFSDEFHTWHAKEVHDYWVFLLQPIAGGASGAEEAEPPHPPAGSSSRAASDADEEPSSGSQLLPSSSSPLERKAAMLQHYVKQYLKGTISIILHETCRFPEEISERYDSLLIQFLQRIGSERELLINSTHAVERGTARHLAQLYEPPQLLHLLEAGQWQPLREKLEAVFTALDEDWADSHEHILEVYHAIVAAVSCTVHKKKQWLSELLPGEYERFVSGMGFHTIAQLRDWTFQVIDTLEAHYASVRHDSRQDLILQIQAYVAENLADATLQSIADHVYLNPSYLSKIYKLETGEGISDYLFRLRMERAAYLLQSTNLKVYEVAERLGYQKTSYFIKLFKDRYQCTPQEFKERTGRP